MNLISLRPLPCCPACSLPASELSAGLVPPAPSHRHHCIFYRIIDRSPSWSSNLVYQSIYIFALKETHKYHLQRLLWELNKPKSWFKRSSFFHTAWNESISPSAGRCRSLAGHFTHTAEPFCVFQIKRKGGKRMGLIIKAVQHLPISYEIHLWW